MKNLRSIPSVDRLLQLPASQQLVLQYGHTLVVNSLRESLEGIRNEDTGKKVSEDEILEMAATALEKLMSPRLVRVINTTGVILHTNLGRSPLSNETIAAIEIAGRSYSNLEYDLNNGSRGSRHVHCEELLKKLSGAEAAMVVNNNAAAMLLILSALLNRRKVAISRSQLVEIGGSFRIPDVMRQSGARLVEVGTTNKTHLADYQEALAAGASAIIRVHSSNFKIIGFSSTPELTKIVEAAHSAGALVVDDLGSGSFLDTAAFGLTHEPMVQESIKAGADLVCFSGDKLLGGPQAGIIVGRKDLVDRIKKHPLARAIRADKLCLAGVAATLSHYLKEEALQEVPVWKMISMQPEVIKLRALYWQEQLQAGDVIPGESTVGGGSLPGDTLPTWLLALDVRSPERMLKSLRATAPRVIARIIDDRIVFDPRTVIEEEESGLITQIGKTYPQYRKAQ
jgi:L-seryl-tRNA(Ser) seleniumtransferase